MSDTLDTRDDLSPESDPEPGTQTEPKAAPEDHRKLPYHQRYYLLYGNPEPVEGIDPEKTLAFLQDVMRYDGGELRQARNSKPNRIPEDPAAEHCSYCHIPISGVDYFRLPDGRKRCGNCSRSLVRSLEDLTRIYKEITNELEVFFNVTLDAVISLEMVEERKLKKKINHSVDSPNDTVLILGCAVSKKGKYTVYLENGIPRLSAIATLVHELTHIWQYTHWNRKALTAKYGKDGVLQVYEGMAKWAEIQYLYHLGEWSAAKREEIITLNREDEYGWGFRLYYDQYGLVEAPMSFYDRTPFSVAADPFGENA